MSQPNLQADTASVRRQHLQTQANPNPKVDYLSVVRDTVGGDEISVLLRYVPDKLVMPPTAFTAYLKAFHTADFHSLETFALTLLEDINNEVVPRWVEITVTQSSSGWSPGHSVTVVDQQPRWNNTGLLSRIAPGEY